MQIDLKSQLRFRSKKQIALTEEANKIALNANSDKRIQSKDSMEAFVIIHKKRRNPT